jgi:hypothetical protein
VKHGIGFCEHALLATDVIASRPDSLQLRNLCTITLTELVVTTPLVSHRRYQAFPGHAVYGQPEGVHLKGLPKG